jgi:nucleoside-diphosphate-sugar epimerase
MKKKIIITGISGFVGDYLFHFFKNKNYKIYGIDNIRPNFSIEKNNFFKVDIKNKYKIIKIITKIKPYAVIHAASILFENLPEKKYWDVNYYATLNLINICDLVGVKKFIFLSTFSVFEKNYKSLVKETSHPTFQTIYGKTKYYAEHVLFSHQFKGNIIVFRCPIIIGPRRMFRFSILYQLIKENINIPIIGDGNNKLSYIHVKDLAEAIEKSFELDKSHILNICADNSLKLKDIILNLIKKNKSKSSIVFFPKWLGGILFSLIIFLKLLPFFRYQKNLFNFNIVLENSRIKKILKWKPKYSVNLMFEENYKYYLKHSENFNIKSTSSEIVNTFRIKIIKKLLKYLF